MAKRSLRVLLTNHQLGEPGGSEVNVRDCALGLLRRGHQPVVYAPVLGRTADLLRDHAIPVVDDLGLITESPDIIHGSHTPTIIESIVRFPRVPALQICQGVGYQMTEPLFLPQVRAYIAVDENNREYMVNSGVASDRIRMMHNAVDLRRIPPRPRPLPDRPKRALIFTKTESQVPLVIEACRRAGIEVATLGRSVGRVVIDPERELVEYDLIFATARSAIEAIAAGCATIVMDGRGLAGMATRENSKWLRQHNFGIRSLQHEVTLDSLAAEIERYDAAEASALSAELRPLIDIESQLDRFERIHAEAIEDFATAPAIREQELLAALVPVLHRWLPRFPGTDWQWQFEKASMIDRLAQLDATLGRERAGAIRSIRELEERHAAERLQAAEDERQRLAVLDAAAEDKRQQLAELGDAAEETRQQLADLGTADEDKRRRLAELGAMLDAATAEADTLRQEIVTMRRSMFWRLRDQFARRPALHRALVRLFVTSGRRSRD